MYDISVIIINYNTAKFTLECINSVFKFTNKALNIEVIVVDNNSEIEDYNYLKKHLPNKHNISLHRSVINTGFGGGNMFATQFATGKYLLFLNNDAYLLNDSINILFNYMENHIDVGVSTAQNYNENQEHTISFDHYKGLRRLLFGRRFLEKINSKKYPKRKKEYTKPIEVNWVNGAFMFFRAKIFNKVGGFDTNIFLYYEEMDICKRLYDNNYKSVLIPQAKIVHHIGGSTQQSKNISKESYISYLYILEKNYSFLKYLAIRCYLIFIILLFKPKRWFLLPILLIGNVLTKSIKLKQQIRPNPIK